MEVMYQQAQGGSQAIDLTGNSGGESTGAADASMRAGISLRATTSAAAVVQNVAGTFAELNICDPDAGSPQRVCDPPDASVQHPVGAAATGTPALCVRAPPVPPCAPVDTSSAATNSHTAASAAASMPFNLSGAVPRNAPVDIADVALALAHPLPTSPLLNVVSSRNRWILLGVRSHRLSSVTLKPPSSRTTGARNP